MFDVIFLAVGFRNGNGDGGGDRGQIYYLRHFTLYLRPGGYYHCQPALVPPPNSFLLSFVLVIEQ